MRSSNSMVTFASARFSGSFTCRRRIICHLAFKNDSSDAEFCKNVFMCWEARLVLPFQLVLRKWRSEVSEGRMAAHRKLDRRRDDLCVDRRRKHASDKRIFKKKRILPLKRQCDPNGIRTRFRIFAMLRNSAT